MRKNSPNGNILTRPAFTAVAGMIFIFWAALSVPIRASSGSETPPDEEVLRSRIGSLPYLQGYKSPPRETGVTVYDRSRAHQGLNFFVSGGSPPIVLMDMEGTILHQWKNPLPNPDLKAAIFRHARLFPDGSLLAILEGKGLLKMDKDANPVWFLPGQYHHDLDISRNGDIYVLNRNDIEIDLEWMDLKGSFKEDFITVISPRGEVQKNISLLKCFLDSDYSPVLLNIRLEEHHGDNFHTNTLELIPEFAGRSFAPFQEGHALISLRNLHTIAVVDLAAGKVTWALSGMWAHQHHPTILPNGNILLFDNLGLKGISQVIEFDSGTQKIAWAYRGDEENGFRTEDMGFQQRLPNGNTLITESRDGRVFEVTPENAIVWEYLNPQQSGPENNLIATIYELTRLTPEDAPFLTENGD